ncbi:MAG TPA: hypothetical protein DEO70_03035 [Bacteroidales bacterium]|nr:MAG: hypothetical protein A2X11_09425 [Bacteroidetes bacterium GWE2_42_24]OFY25773.1 MAG: hypothetical protein A2X09_09325 [Bacteroidetes bacterium GWF2_43_11]HBZ65785.1 hypothetical protein [Bacteroidales bacterium]
MRYPFFSFPSIVLSFLLFAGCGVSKSGDMQNIPPLNIRPVTYQKAEKVCGDLQPDSLTLELFSLSLDSVPEGLLVDSLRAFIDRFVLATDSADMLAPDPDSLFSQFVGNWQKTMDDFEGPCQGWTISRKIEPLLNKSGLFSLSALDFSFMGGAHPNTQIRLMTFDLTTGQPVDIRLIINNDQQDAFLKRVEKSFRQVHELSDTASWSYNGFWFDKGFSLPQYMALTPDGLYLMYNQYEVAPYAAGTTELMIPIDEFLAFLKPEWRDRVAAIKR